MRITKKKAIRLILILFFLTIAVLAGRKAYLIHAENQSGEDAYTDLEQYVQLPAELPARPDPPDEEPEQSESEEIPASIFPRLPMSTAEWLVGSTVKTP